MKKSENMMMKIVAADDAKWDHCFVDLKTNGIRTNTRFTAYNPPSDPKFKLEYDRTWNKAKTKKT